MERRGLGGGLCLGDEMLRESFLGCCFGGGCGGSHSGGFFVGSWVRVFEL